MIIVENEQAGRSYHFHNLDVKRALIITYADAEMKEIDIATRHEELFGKYDNLVEAGEAETLKIGNWIARELI